VILHGVPFPVKPFLRPPATFILIPSARPFQIKNLRRPCTKALRPKLSERFVGAFSAPALVLLWDGFGGFLTRQGNRIATYVLCAATSVLLLSFAGTIKARSATPLETILTHLDEEAKDFHSLSADMQRTKVTVVVNDHSTETGSILLRGDKMLLQMKAGNTDTRTILRSGDTLFLYTPGLKRVEEYDLGKNRAMVDQFLLLGFGTSGKELERGYEIALLNEGTLDDKKTAELQLTPKSDAARKQISQIHIWIDESTWVPIQQEFIEAGSGDYSTVKYSKIVRNPNIPESVFKPHWPKGTERIKPQG
jgi:outer membrane lipoprotein-sorting protein